MKSAAAFGVALLLAACGGSSEDVDLTGADIVVEAFDNPLVFDAELYRLSPGESTIGYLNVQRQLHTLVIEGRNDLALRINGPGDAAIGTVDLPAGRYVLFCDVPGHRAAGMEAVLLVE